MAKIFTAFTLFTEYEILSYETARRFHLQLDPSIKGPGTQKKNINILHFMGLKNVLLQQKEGS